MWWFDTNFSQMWGFGTDSSHVWGFGTNSSHLWKFGINSSHLRKNCYSPAHVKNIKCEIWAQSLHAKNYRNWPYVNFTFAKSTYWYEFFTWCEIDEVGNLWFNRAFITAYYNYLCLVVLMTRTKQFLIWCGSNEQHKKLLLGQNKNEILFRIVRGGGLSIGLSLRVLTPQKIGNVECLTRDRGATGASLTVVTMLCPWERHNYLCLVLIQPRKTRLDITEKLLTGS